MSLQDVTPREHPSSLTSDTASTSAPTYARNAPVARASESSLGQFPGATASSASLASRGPTRKQPRPSNPTACVATLAAPPPPRPARARGSPPVKNATVGLSSASRSAPARRPPFPAPGPRVRPSNLSTVTINGSSAFRTRGSSSDARRWKISDPGRMQHCCSISAGSAGADAGRRVLREWW